MRTMHSALVERVEGALVAGDEVHEVVGRAIRQAVSGAVGRLGYRGDMPLTYYTLTPVDVDRITDALLADLQVSPVDPGYVDLYGRVLAAVRETADEVNAEAGNVRVVG